MCKKDWVYYLLDIFDISIPAIYRESRKKTIVRLKKEIKEVLNDNTQNRSIYLVEFNLHYLVFVKTWIANCRFNT
jgi:hypothetical protein